MITGLVLTITSTDFTVDRMDGSGTRTFSYLLDVDGIGPVPPSPVPEPFAYVTIGLGLAVVVTVKMTSSPGAARALPLNAIENRIPTSVQVGPLANDN
jgi:hypothetical protein